MRVESFEALLDDFLTVRSLMRFVSNKNIINRNLLIGGLMAGLTVQFKFINNFDQLSATRGDEVVSMRFISRKPPGNSSTSYSLIHELCAILHQRKGKSLVDGFVFA